MQSQKIILSVLKIHLNKNTEISKKTIILGLLYVIYAKIFSHFESQH